MIFSAAHLYEEIISQKFPKNFNSISKIEKGLKFRIIGKDNPRNNVIEIVFKKKQFVFKQPRVYTGLNLETFENEIQYYKNFKVFGIDYFYEENKKYIIFPKFHYIQANRLLFIENKIFNYRIINKFIIDSLKLYEDFSNDSNVKSKVETFHKNNSSEIVPYYLYFLKKFNTSRLNQKIDEIFLNNECSIKRKKVRPLIVSFLKKKETIKFFEKLIKTHSFENDQIIHGDFEIRNIMEIDNTLTLIDFELVSKGDQLWDLVCFLESLFLKKFTLQIDGIYETRFQITTLLLNSKFKNLSQKNTDKFINYLIINKIRFLLDDNTFYSNSFTRNLEMIQSIEILMSNVKRFGQKLINGAFDFETKNFLFSAGCGK